MCVRAGGGGVCGRGGEVCEGVCYQAPFVLSQLKRSAKCFFALAPRCEELPIKMLKKIINEAAEYGEGQRAREGKGKGKESTTGSSN